MSKKERMALAGVMIGIITVLLACTGCGNATRGASGKQQAEAKQRLDQADPVTLASKLTDRMESALHLDAAQKEKVQEINLRYLYEVKELAGGEGGKFAKLSRFREMQSRKDGELRAILSPEQIEKYLQLKSELQEATREAVKDRR